MSHHPYEEWILTDDRLTPQQTEATRQHLESCSHCRLLQSQWQAARLQMRTGGMKTPAPGFVNRWQKSLPVRHARQQVQSAKRLVIFMLGLTVAMLLAWGIYFMVSTTPADIVAAVFKTAARGVILFSEFKYEYLPVFRSIPAGYYLAGWILATTSALALAAIWGGAVWHYTFRKSNKSELIQEGVQ